LQGILSDAREKGLVDERLLMVSLKKRVETLSDVLDVDAPILNDEEKEMETSDGKGMELWNRGSANGEENLGPFDDEETRSFYCTVPDLLSTKPPALLGINLNEVEKLKERNLRVYGGNSGEEGGEIVMEDDETCH
jgi:regulator of nonsense transcripts 2